MSKQPKQPKAGQTDIPWARSQLASALAISTQPEVRALIRAALSKMTRSVRGQPRTISNKVTSKMVLRVKSLIRQHPDLTDREIGEMVNINSGRVCEIRNGHRTVGNPSMSHDGFNRELAKRQGRTEE